MFHLLKKFSHISWSNIMVYLIHLYHHLFKTLYMDQWSIGSSPEC